LPGARLGSQSEGVRNRRIEHVNTVRGDITDRDLLERALGEGDGSR
jgi:hypothetical protein